MWQVLFHLLKGDAKRGVSSASIPENPDLNNLNALLHDMYIRYIALNDDDFEQYYGIFEDIFNKLHKKMKAVDPYYNRYSSEVQVAGSHYDKCRINKPDEFDMDIVIKLPLNYHHDRNKPEASDIVLEPQAPGFMQLKMGKNFQEIHLRDVSNWSINQTAYKWKDEDHYLLRSKFINWFKGVVDKALNEFKPRGQSLAQFDVKGETYTVRKSESGPAVTLYIENKESAKELAVDLVPSLKFPKERWLPASSGYREISSMCEPPHSEWSLVPKPDRTQNRRDITRCWRLAMHEQERGLMQNTYNLRHAIRLIKKLRDSQEMVEISSYYIKTLFFWEVKKREADLTFWQRDPATLFKIMVKKLHKALVAGRIPYFWHGDNNLIGHVSRSTLDEYVTRLAKLLEVLNTSERYKEVAFYMLNCYEFTNYNEYFLHIPDPYDVINN